MYVCECVCVRVAHTCSSCHHTRHFTHTRNKRDFRKIQFSFVVGACAHDTQVTHTHTPTRTHTLSLALPQLLDSINSSLSLSGSVCSSFCLHTCNIQPYRIFNWSVNIAWAAHYMINISLGHPPPSHCPAAHNVLQHFGTDLSVHIKIPVEIVMQNCKQLQRKEFPTGKSNYEFLSWHTIWMYDHIHTYISFHIYLRAANLAGDKLRASVQGK